MGAFKHLGRRAGVRLHNNSSVSEVADRLRERAEAAAAYDAMRAARPLTPPPITHAAPTRTTGAVELAAEIRAGHYRPPRGPAPAVLHTNARVVSLVTEES